MNTVEIKETEKTKYPYGIFWTFPSKGTLPQSRINVERLLVVAHGLGFRKYKSMIMQQSGQILYRRYDSHILSALKKYVKEDTESYILICNWLMKAFPKITRDFQMVNLLKEIHQEEILVLVNTDLTKYVRYRNGYVTIENGKEQFTPYEKTGKLVLTTLMLERDY